ncbi:Presenilin-like protein [Vigna angularis]|uniref:Presenilin-like protein n=1 Tax=Phaseolus angularis TaxID=3914 RepID=A0A8T0KDI1_PHAAN|nr:Presenilin-like protein [Vigna angularis]
MSPVSIYMFLVVLLVYALSSPSSSAATITTAANLVYAENPADSPAEKFEGALLNAIVFVGLIALVTFLLVLLYYYNWALLDERGQVVVAILKWTSVLFSPNI